MTLLASEIEERARLEQLARVNWPLRKIERFLVTSGDFDWVAWEDLIEDAAQLEASSPASRATIERIFVKRRAKAKSVKELVIADL
jgi:hypothetical protein